MNRCIRAAHSRLAARTQRCIRILCRQAVLFAVITLPLSPQTAFAVHTASAIASGSDDAEESANGNVTLGSSDIELTADGSNQTIGLRFDSIAVPTGAVIEKAYIQFQVDEVSTGPAQLTIAAQASSNPAGFLSQNSDVSARSRLGTSVEWTPAEWTTVGQRTTAQRTPDLSSVVQAVVNQSDWNARQAIAFIITGDRQANRRILRGQSFRCCEPAHRVQR